MYITVKNKEELKMNKIIAKLENFEAKLNGMFKGNEELPYALGIELKEVEDFKKSFTADEIKKLKDFQIKLFYEGYKSNFVQALLLFLGQHDCKELTEIKEPLIEKMFDYNGYGESIALYWNNMHIYNHVNLTFLIQQIKENMYLDKVETEDLYEYVINHKYAY